MKRTLLCKGALREVRRKLFLSPSLCRGLKWMCINVVLGSLEALRRLVVMLCYNAPGSAMVDLVDWPMPCGPIIIVPYVIYTLVQSQSQS